MFTQSIRRKIVGIALGLVVLMIGTSILSMLMANRVGHLVDELTNKYVPAYGDLARTNVRSLERALALRQMVIAKMQAPPDDVAFAQRMQIYRTKDGEITEEAEAARKLIVSIIEDTSTPSDNVALALIDGRIEAAVTDVRRLLNDENSRLITQLEAHDFPEVQRSLKRIDALRDEFNQRIDQIRADMLAQVYASAATVMVDQQRVIWITVVVTAIAAILGLLFAGLVGAGITRPVRLLLQGTREVEAGQLDRPIDVVTRDEIGQLTAAFNRMVGQLRQKEQIRRTFGRYIDPRVVEGLINQSAAGTEGQRRVMTVMFCDMKGFTRLSEGMTPQGLVKVMNRYLSTMSEPIRAQQGIIDKYIGDAIMAYWGPPFSEEADEARLACLAATRAKFDFMLFRSQTSGVLAISQPTHAWISGQILRAWDDNLRETLLLAAEQHDVGWLDWETEPTFNPSTGRPHLFREVGAATHAPMWTKGVQRARDAWGTHVAVLVSRHGGVIYRRFIDRHRMNEADAAAAQNYLDTQAPIEAAWRGHWGWRSRNSRGRRASSRSPILCLWRSAATSRRRSTWRRRAGKERH